MRDIDRTPPQWLVNTFCEYTGVDNKIVQQTTLETYKNRLFAENRVSGHQKWILTLNQVGTKRRGYGQQYCPKCLAEDPIPYFRRQWRLALVTYCPKHQIELYDACPGCDKPVVYYRVDFGRDAKEVLPIFACYNCGYDLRGSKCIPVYFPSVELRDVYDEVHQFLSCEETKSCRINGEFLDVTHQLCKVMGTRSNSGKLLGYISKEIGMPEVAKPNGWITIEERRRNDRHVWLLCALWLVSKFECRIYQAWNKRAILYSLLTKDFTDAPRWFLEAVAVLSNWRKRTN